ncbi:hypothetical protein CON48_11365 [Bacillus thuringiensis]|uniref:Uncharacterized protein n=5 Tax=Bacillus cereus group TaxID=86661 RepID=A0A9W5QUU6_BACCE|nr:MULTISPECIES: hypothetical protein [Bacillus]AJQ59112.1 hypothetical protein SD98_12680 [Bacillus thuringiensis serovar morrisoni]AMR84860.1 hypothetical protein A3L20_12800 [Bacillus thuringiensis]ANC07868.1 hypothetical protein WR47_12445 [Bacillus cereus]ANC13690.1 hypothetical protein WR51_12455 [Bacillus cereus]EEK59059.1 hypothetical protein bcere0005_52410 [Bacillus cereus 172560W]
MGSSPYFNKNVSYQTSSIPITEVTQKKSRIIAAEAVTLPKTNNETTNEAINGTTDEKLKKQKNNSSDYSPFQINIPYFNIKITSTEILGVAKSVFMQALIQKVQDPVFLMNLLNSEGGKKLLNLAGDFFKDTATKSENDKDEN